MCDISVEFRFKMLKNTDFHTARQFSGAMWPPGHFV